MPSRNLIGGALAFALCASSDAAADDVGYVLARQGRWTLQGSAVALEVGAPVAAGARLLVAEPAVGDHVVVVEARSGAVLVAHRCDTARACTVPVVVPAVATAASTEASVAPLLRRVLARLAGEPERYVATISRGSVPLGDAVVSSVDDGVDVAALLAGVPDGGYELRLATLRCRSGASCPARPLTARAGADERPGVLRGAGAGLYQLTVSRPTAGGPPRAVGWILVVPAGERAAVEARRRAGLDLVERWGDAVAAPTRRAFSRALLDALVEP